MKITEKQKNVLREMVGFCCEECGRPEDICGKLEAHRIQRGNAGGKYIPRNIKMVCSHCHKLYHGEEF